MQICLTSIKQRWQHCHWTTPRAGVNLLVIDHSWEGGADENRGPEYREIYLSLRSEICRTVEIQVGCTHARTNINHCIAFLRSLYLESHPKSSWLKDLAKFSSPFSVQGTFNKHCRARPCKWPQPYDPDFTLSMSHLFGICHKEV